MNISLSKLLIVLVIITSIIYIVLAAFAPIARHHEWNRIADIIYYVYGFICHQKPWRSIHFFDYQMAFCVRDLFIFMPVIFIGIFSLFNKINFRKISLFLVILLATPMIVDGSSQLLSEIVAQLTHQSNYYESTNFIRFLTATPFGIAIALIMFKIIQEEFGTKQQKVSINPLIIVFLTLIICFIIYVMLIAAWNTTSQKYKPTSIIDTQSYIPGVNYEQTKRKGHIR